MSDSTISVAPEQPALVYPQPLVGDDVEAYLDLRRDAAWFEAMNHWSSIQGPKAMEALNGLVTNDVSQLAVGMGMHAIALTPKGKVVCDMYIARTDDDRFMLTVLRHCAPAWIDLARKYINPRLAKVVDESEQWATWMLYGTNAAQAVANLGGAAHTVENLGDIMVQGLAEWPVWSHGMWNIGPVSVRLVRAPVMGSLPGFVIVADARDTALVRERLDVSTRRQASRAVWNIARVEGGRPAFGIDMDENTIPQEANLDTLGAISFTKGCYTWPGDGRACPLPRARESPPAGPDRRSAAAPARPRPRRQRQRRGGRAEHGCLAETGEHRAGHDPARSGSWGPCVCADADWRDRGHHPGAAFS
ncbi:MAG: hypothetical protein HEQ11_01905 [Gemmatimonas sp.]